MKISALHFKKKLRFTRYSLSMWLTQAMIFLVSMEFMYSPGSGTYNIYLLMLLSAFLPIVYIGGLSGSFRLKRSDLLCLIMIVWLVFWGSGTEPIRYGMAFFVIWMLRRFPFRSMRTFHVLLVVVGAVRTILMYASSPHLRAVGFYTGSPTLFSMSMCISIYYLCNSYYRKPKDWIYCIIAFVCILLTESRSTILAAVGIMAYALLESFLRKNQKQLPIAVAIIGCVAFLALLVAADLFDFNSFMTSRDNAQDSLLTRTGMISRFLTELSNDFSMLMIGRGGGYTLSRLNIGTGHLPLHQDILMMVCEYGLIGTVLLVYAFFKNSKMDIVMWALLIVGTFHNFVICTIVILQFISTMEAIASENHTSIIRKGKKQNAKQIANK